MGCSFLMVIICIKKMAHRCLDIFGTIIVASMESERSGLESWPGILDWAGLDTRNGGIESQELYDACSFSE